MKTLAAALLLAGTCSCAMPATTVSTPDSRPSLAVQGAPPGALLFVDGIQVGEAAAYSGTPLVLRVEPGTHDVEVRTPAGAVILKQRVFIESETKTLQVR